MTVNVRYTLDRELADDESVTDIRVGQGVFKQCLKESQLTAAQAHAKGLKQLAINFVFCKDGEVVHETRHELDRAWKRAEQASTEEQESPGCDGSDFDTGSDTGYTRADADTQSCGDDSDSTSAEDGNAPKGELACDGVVLQEKGSDV